MKKVTWIPATVTLEQNSDVRHLRKADVVSPWQIAQGHDPYPQHDMEDIVASVIGEQSKRVTGKAIADEPLLLGDAVEFQSETWLVTSLLVDRGQTVPRGLICTIAAVQYVCDLATADA